jgi:hypothetical protein
MQNVIRIGLLSFVVVAFAVGCGSDANPHPVNVKQDTRLKRMGEGNPEAKQPGQNSQAFSP